MALVEREISRTEENGLCVVSIEFDDADGRIQRMIMRGSINERSVMTAYGDTGAKAVGLADQPEMVMDLLPDNIFMIDEGGVWKRPSWMGAGMDNLEPAPEAERVTRRTRRIKDEPVRERTR